MLSLEVITGLSITFGPFHAAIEWGVLGHTAVGVATLVPVAWYLWVHWLDYRRHLLSHIVLLGYVAGIALLVCLVSGVVVTWQGLFGTHMSQWWRRIHLISTFVTLGTSLPHVLFALARVRHDPAVRAARIYILEATGVAILGTVLLGAGSLLYSGTRYVNTFPEGYEFPFGKDRPFAPSLAQTSTGGAFDARSLSGSTTCGSAGCHVQIVEEWKPSAHRYAAMDTLFQGIQSVMAKQNGPESTRYCGGCHDPISLFSGTKNIFVENLTSLQGYNEGVSCLACHSVQKTDLQGNANYTVVQPDDYLWQWSERGPAKVARDFLIRTYPAQHNKLSKRMFKAPEYCAACHKQFIDKEVNRVGWVQLQNQYDNWAMSHWNHKDDPRKTIECRECHTCRSSIRPTPPRAMTGDVAGALSQLEELTRIDPQSQRAYRQWGAWRAMSATSAADLVAAEQALQRALAINPEETGTLLLLGEIALLRGEAGKAEERLAQLPRFSRRFRRKPGRRLSKSFVLRAACQYVHNSD